MKEFPEKLRPENKEKLKDWKKARSLAYLRRDIYENILLGDENNYFDITKFSEKHSLTEEQRDELVRIVEEELQKLGWKTKVHFGGTGLFIYSTDELPPSCVGEEL